MPRKVKDCPPRDSRVLKSSDANQLDELILQRVIATREVHTMLETERARVLSKLTALVSDMSDPSEIKILSLIEQGLVMKRVAFGSFPLPTHAHPVDNLTFERVDELHTRLEAELRKQSQILSVLTALVTGPPEIKTLPHDIQEAIMKRLPVESLVRFRCVSKTWKSLIDSSEFIAAHRNQPQHLLVQCCENYFSFPDNKSFPRLSFVRALPPSIRLSITVGSSYGLLCFYCFYSNFAVIWNPSIRKSIVMDVPKEFNDGEVDTNYGFGVCPVTLDPKFVHITHLCPPQAREKSESETKEFGKFWKVNVYKLSSGKFTNISRSSRLPPVSRRIARCKTQVVIDRHIYWCAEKDGMNARSLIMSFDITDEKFKPVDIPDSLATLSPYYLSLSKLGESLVLLEYNNGHSSYAVWKMMDDGLLFTKLFTINAPCGSRSIRAVGFRKTGGPIMELYDSNLCSKTALVAYDEPDSRDCKVLISGFAYSYTVEFYMETLLLIGRSDTTSF